MSRNYHAMTTRYNVAFNSGESYKEGLDVIYNENEDDFTKLIPLFPISNKASQSLATSQMERAIEKAMKAERLHSIRKKPKKDAKKMKDPKFLLFLQKEEYNREMGRVWLLHGKAQFHNADFLGAVGTFSYVIKHFSQEKKRVEEAKIWLARAYMEMDWIYDAEDIVEKLDKEELFEKNITLFSAVKADLLLRNGEKQNAIEPLMYAADNERKKRQRVRYEYVLAQLFHEKNDISRAAEYYKRTAKHSTSYQMDFNAQVSLAEVNYLYLTKAEKTLLRMANNPKYADGLDKIYTALGNVYLKNEMFDKAVAAYRLAIEKSTQNGVDKIKALITLADHFYEQSKYIDAQPNYAEAKNLMKVEHDDFERVSNRAQVLGELVAHHQIVVLQDSLQRLARMSESERNQTLRAMIDRLKKEEAEELQRLAEEAKKAERGFVMEANEDYVSNVGSTTSTAWYFYNSNLISKGKSEFQRLWGVRKLEDNWRRKNKAASSTMMNDYENEEIVLVESDSVNTNGQIVDAKSETSSGVASNVISDIQYYIDQLPTTSEQLKQSDAQIATALFAMGCLYQEGLEDLPMAIKTFEELERRFPSDERIADAYFLLYQMYKKQDESAQADWYRSQLVRRFPESNYAKVLGRPDYEQSLKMMVAMQDSIYEQTYNAYLHNHFDSVRINMDYIKQEYPLSTLVPKFQFLAALSKGKQGNNVAFEQELNTLIEEYPQSDVSAMAKSILAMYAQGRRVQAGSTHGSMIAKRDSIIASVQQSADTLQFQMALKDLHCVAMLVPNSLNINRLQYDFASYNFAGFLVRDFDMVAQRYDNRRNIVIVSTLTDLNEAFWYMANIEQDKVLAEYIAMDSCRTFAIATENLEILKKGRTIEDYLTFYVDSLLPLRKKEVIDLSSAEAQRRSVKEAAIAAERMAQEAELRAEQEASEEAIRQMELEEARQKAEQIRRREERANRKNSTKETQPSVSESPKSSDKSASITQSTVKNEVEKESVSEQKNPLVDEILSATAQKATYVQDDLSPHSYAILIQNGTADLSAVKKAFEAFNARYYRAENLNVKTYSFGDKQMLVVSSFTFANSAKNYMFGVIRERSLFTSISRVAYRSVIISNNNLEQLKSTGDFDGYVQFFK